MAYYYLAAQLPYLIYGQTAPMTAAAFKAQCLTALSAADGALLDFCTLDPEPPVLSPSDRTPGGTYVEVPRRTGSDFIDNWRHWERTLRLNLARFRVQRLKREGGAAIDPPDFPADAVSAAKAAASMDSPLDAELYLDRARWDAIEAFQGLYYFGVNTIYAYLLKLQLMERWALFKVEEGFAEYKGLYASIMDRSGTDVAVAENASKRNESGEPK